MQPLIRTSLALAGLVLAIGPLLASERALPKEAKRTIAAVQTASKNRDFASLRKLMKTEFVWSFGGDGSADQALQEWKRSPAALKELARVTSGSCSYVDPALIQCPVHPGHAGLDYRAGFQQTNNGWEMIYFVAGD